MIERHPRKQFIILGLLACIKATTGITIAAIFMVILAYLYMLREWNSSPTGTLPRSSGLIA